MRGLGSCFTLISKELFKACTKDLFLVQPYFTLLDEDCLSLFNRNGQLDIAGRETINACRQRDVNVTRPRMSTTFLEPSSPHKSQETRLEHVKEELSIWIYYFYY